MAALTYGAKGFITSAASGWLLLGLQLSLLRSMLLRQLLRLLQVLLL